MRQKEKRRNVRLSLARETAAAQARIRQAMQYINSAECRCGCEFDPWHYPQCPSCHPHQFNRKLRV